MKSRPIPSGPPQPVQWLLWRQNLKNYFRSMDEDRERCARRRARGQTFAEICAALTDGCAEEEIPLRAATLMGTWADSGLIVGIG